jgi:adenylate kinase family enzyme
VAFDRLVQKIRANGGKVQEEVVTIKVLKKESMELVKQHLAESAKISKVIAAKINEYLKSEWYAALCNKAALVEDMKERYRVEKEGLTEVFSRLTGEYSDSLSLAVIEELKIVCDRMEFRFNLVVEKGGIPRPDEYPLSVIRRLAVYTGETAPVFLEQTAEKNAKKGYYVVSSAGTPQEVIAEILTTLAGAAEITDQWESILSLAGEIANSIVYKKELVVEELLKRVGGILES